MSLWNLSWLKLSRVSQKLQGMLHNIQEERAFSEPEESTNGIKTNTPGGKNFNFHEIIVILQKKILPIVSLCICFTLHFLCYTYHALELLWGCY